MQYSLPSDQIHVEFSDIPTNATVCVQIRNTSGLTEVGRTPTGVDQDPPGSGIFTYDGIAPASEGTYVVIADWDGGELEDGFAKFVDLTVSSTVPVESSGLGPIADAAKSHLSGIFDKLVRSPSYGTALVVAQIEVVKARVLKTPPATADEGSLNRVVIDYLGKLCALALIPGAIALLQDEVQSRTTGNNPLETVTYVDRLKVIQELEEILQNQIDREEALALSLIEDPNTTSGSDSGPLVSNTGQRVTQNPSHFPTIRDFPYDRHEQRRRGTVFG